MEMKPSGGGYPVHVTTVRERRKLNTVLVVALCFCLVAVVLMCVAVATPKWLDAPRGHFGLWTICEEQRDSEGKYTGTWQCRSYIGGLHSTDDSSLNIFMYVCRGLLFAGIGFSGLSLLLLGLACFHIGARGCAIASGVLLVFSSLFCSAVIAFFGIVFFYVAVFTGGLVGGILQIYGYSFILCCVGDVLAFVAGILGYVGACTESRDATPGVIIAA